MWTGLLECPLTTRVRKVIQANYVVHSSGPACGSLAIKTAAECYEAVSKLLPNTTITTSVVSDAKLPAGCAVESQAGGHVAARFNKLESSSVSCGGAGSTGRVSGVGHSLVHMELALDKASDTARITLQGPATVWYGVGFNASQMSDRPWAVIVDGKGAVTERKLVDQKAGTLLKTSVKVVSNTVADGVRTVVVTRPLKGATAEYYSFDVDGPSHMPFIDAVGSGPVFSYHKAKAPSSLLLLPEAAPACVCAGHAMNFGDGSCKGSISYVPTGQKEDIGDGAVNFNNECAPEPASQLLTQHNPTCDIRTYTGGQLSCHHMWSLLDAEQEIPWAGQPLNYFFKWRFWCAHDPMLVGQKRLAWSDMCRFSQVPGVQGLAPLPRGNLRRLGQQPRRWRRRPRRRVRRAQVRGGHDGLPQGVDPFPLRHRARTFEPC